MSFASKSKAPDTKPQIPAKPDRLAGNDAGRVLPVFWGVQKLSGTYISKVFNLATKTRKSKDGKEAKSGGAGGGGTDYWASFAMAICHGPITAIREIWMDGNRVWAGDTAAVGDSTSITVTSRGVVKIYHGTLTQTADSHLNNTASPALARPLNQDHPAYRGVCYAVFNRLYLGRNRTNIPNIEFVLERHTADTNANVADDHNAPFVIKDVLTNTRYGLGIPAGRLNTTEIAETAATLFTEGFGASPLLTGAVGGRQFINGLLDYFGGYQRVGEDGKWSCRLARSNAPVDLLSLGPNDFIGQPKMMVEDWSQSRSQTRVVFLNRDAGFREDVSVWRDSASFSITQENATQTVQRPWITRQLVARQIAGASGAAAALPDFTLRGKVKSSAIPANAIGQRIAITYAPLGLSNFICRCVEQSLSAPAGGESEITLKHERTWLNSSIYGTADDFISDADEASAIAPVYQKLIELPYDLSIPAKGEGMPVASIAALLVRPDDVTTAYSVWKKKSATNPSYVEIGRDDAFTIHGNLTATYTSATHTIDQGIGFSVQIDSADNDLVSVELEDALSDDTLIFIGDEILSLISATLVSGTTFRVYAVRSRYDTRRLSHASGRDVWIIPRKIITPFTHADASKKGAVYTYKLQTLVDDSEVALSALAPLSLTMTARHRRPTGPRNLRKVASSTTFRGEMREAMFADPSTINLRWDLTDPRHDDFWLQWKKRQTPPWSATEAYDVLDEVSHEIYAPGTVPVTYIANQPSTGKQPGVTAGWAEYWHVKQNVPVPGTELSFGGWSDDGFGGFDYIDEMQVFFGSGVTRYSVATTKLLTWFGVMPDWLNIKAYGWLGGLESRFVSTLDLFKI